MEVFNKKTERAGEDYPDRFTIRVENDKVKAFLYHELDVGEEPASFSSLNQLKQLLLEAIEEIDRFEENGKVFFQGTCIMCRDTHGRVEFAEYFGNLFCLRCWNVLRDMPGFFRNGVLLLLPDKEEGE